MQRLEVLVGALILIFFVTLGFSQLKLHEDLSLIRSEAGKVYFKIEKGFLERDQLFNYSTINTYDDNSYKGKTFCHINIESIKIKFLGDFKASFIVHLNEKNYPGMLELIPLGDKVKATVVKGHNKGKVFFLSKLISRENEGLESFLVDGAKLTNHDCHLFGANSR